MAREGALPDSVVVRMPHRDLTARDVQLAWVRLSPRYRPQGEGVELRRALVDQLIEKELLARAALAEPFVMTRPESARYLTRRAELLRYALYRTLVLDRIEVTDADREQARGDVGTGADVDTSLLQLAARRRAEARQAEAATAEVRAGLAPSWDDSVVALVARGFAALPPLQQRLGEGMAIRISNQVPEFAPADTGRVLVTSTAGTITVGGFVQRFLALNPFERTYPVTPGEVRARGEQFLGSTWFLHEAERRGLDRDPEVVRGLAERREEFALDHYYDRRIASAVDTSEAKARAHYESDPGAWAVGEHYVLHRMAFATQAELDSVRAVLAAGARWEDVCAARAADERSREACLAAQFVWVQAAEPALLDTLAARAPGDVFEREGQLFRYHEHVPRRVRSYDEARTFVVRDLAMKQSEARLQAVLAELKATTPVAVNTRAVAELDLGPDTP